MERTHTQSQCLSNTTNHVLQGKEWGSTTKMYVKHYDPLHLDKEWGLITTVYIKHYDPLLLSKEWGSNKMSVWTQN